MESGEAGVSRFPMLYPFGCRAGKGGIRSRLHQDEKTDFVVRWALLPEELLPTGSLEFGWTLLCREFSKTQT